MKYGVVLGPRPEDPGRCFQVVKRWIPDTALCRLIVIASPVGAKQST
jgi:hypothetical protein